MAHDHRTLYEILGITRNAKPHEIERAYRRLRGRMQQEAVAPDVREAVLLQKAHEVLSDPARRDAYDRSLVQPASILQRARASRRTRAYVAGGGLLAALAVGGAYYTWRSTFQATPHRDPAEIAQAASLAVGRVQAVDVAGTVKALGLAFAVEQGMLATSCEGLTPTTQLVVSFAQRRVPARVATIYGKDGVCRLAAEGMGSWPLSIASRIPRIGAAVYATQVEPGG
ncbi:MAG TPA: J domain-containing protein, partial [Usitatibacter sp.]|nr:J domain-containing protein [Usitatibacter sp.]